MKSPAAVILIVGALAVGLLAVLPQILIWRDLAVNNQSFLLNNMNSYNDVTRGFVPRVREIYDNFLPSMELSLPTGGPFLFPLLPPYLSAIFLWVFLGNANLTYLAINFVFSAAVFVITFFIGRLMMKTTHLWSLLIALLASFSPLLLYLPRALLSLENFKNIALTTFYPGVRTLLDRLFLSNLENPLIAVPFFLLAFLMLYLFWEKPTIPRAIRAAIFNGLMFNVYFFNWVYLVIVIGLLGIYTLWQRRLQTRESLKAFFVFLAILALFATPFFINYISFGNHPTSDEYVPRYAEVEYSRFFRFSLGHSRAGITIYGDYIFYAILAVMTFFAFRKEDKNKMIFYLISILAMFVVWNVQIVTGYVPEAFHWWMVVSVISFVILFDLLQFYSKRINHRWVTAALLLLIVLLGTKRIVNAAMFISPPEQFVQDYSFDSDVISSWQWINESLPKNSRIISPSVKTTIYLNDYTTARPYLPLYIHTLATTEELERRFVIANKLFGVSENMFLGRIEQNQDVYKKDLEGVMNSVYGNKYRNIHYNGPFPSVDFFNRPPEEKVKYLLGEYRSISPTWKGVEADYIYVGPFEKDLGVNGNFAVQQDLASVYKNSSVEIYQINK